MAAIVFTLALFSPALVVAIVVAVAEERDLQRRRRHRTRRAIIRGHLA